MKTIVNGKEIKLFNKAGIGRGALPALNYYEEIK